MDHDEEIDARQRLTRHWLESESAVRAYVFAAVRGFHDAEDLVQQVALTAARRFDEYDATRPFVGWVLWLAKSRVIDHYRKQGRERLVFSETLLDELADTLAQRQPECGARLAAMEHCIGKLPEKSRQLLALRYGEDAPMDRVAAEVDSTAASVRVMLFRIRNLLAECIQSELVKETR